MRLVLATLAVLGLAAAPARGADHTLVESPRGTPVDAHAGTVAWSAWDADAGTYRLVLHRAGVAEVVPVAPSREPFDVDLGPGPDGETVAVYPRCERGGCDVALYDPASRRERRVAAAARRGVDERQPSVWGERVAFVSQKRGVPRLRLARLAGGARPRPLPGGAAREARVEDLELARDRVAFVWTQAQPDGGEGTLTAVYSGRLGSPSHVVARAGTGAMSFARFSSPSYAGPWLYFGFLRYGDGALRSRVVRARLGSGRLEHADLPEGHGSVVRDGASTYYAAQGGEADPEQPTRVVRLDRMAFRPYRATRWGPGYGPPRRNR